MRAQVDHKHSDLAAGGGYTHLPVIPTPRIASLFSERPRIDDADGDNRAAEVIPGCALGAHNECSNPRMVRLVGQGMYGSARRI